MEAFSGDWEKLKTLFTDDVCYRVRNTAELRGLQAVADDLVKMLTTVLALNVIE